MDGASFMAVVAGELELGPPLSWGFVVDWRSCLNTPALFCGLRPLAVQPALLSLTLPTTRYLTP